MKKIVLLIATVAVSLSACSQKYYPSMYQPAEASPVQEQMSHVNDPVPPTAQPQPQPQPEIQPVRVTETTDTYTVNGAAADYTYYIVVGSFANADNAARMRKDLKERGIAALVASNGKGMHRVVLAEASNDEPSVRNALLRMRQTFPDAWILKLSR